MVEVTNYTLANVPFRILRPALNLLPTIVSSILTQVYVKDKAWEYRKLAAKIIALKGKTDALKNPARRTTLVHLTSWYGLALELADAVAVTHPALSEILRNAAKEVDWLQPSWDYMVEQMSKWVQDNGGASA